MRHIQKLRDEGIYFVPENATDEELHYFENEVERRLERLHRTDLAFTGEEAYRAEIVLQNVLAVIQDMRKTGYWCRRAEQQR
jgi:hypothetical protein